MPWVGFEPTIPASARPQTYGLERAATGIGQFRYLLYLIKDFKLLHVSPLEHKLNTNCIYKYAFNLSHSAYKLGLHYKRYTCWDIHVGNYENCHFMGCNIVWSGISLSTFRINFLPPSSVWLKMRAKLHDGYGQRLYSRSRYYRHLNYIRFI
jgi:hypothetical protein